MGCIPSPDQGPCADMIAETWRETEFLSIAATADILCRSRASVYDLLRKGVLTAVVVGERPLVATATLAALLDGAKPYTPGSARGPLGRARARAALELA